MITAEQNELLTKIGPGTPGGDWLRRYWWPIAMAKDLKDKPTWVRLLGQDLVLFRDGQGKLGLMDAYCPHRRAHLCLGSVEEDGLRCRYHGWKFGVDGKILEIPGQKSTDKVVTRVPHNAYPVMEAAGLIMAYIGPQPAPLLPQYDFVVGEGDRDGGLLGVSKANWARWAEAGIDPNHVAFLHGEVGGMDDCAAVPDRIAFEETDYGFIHKSWRPGPEPGTTFYREHHHIFPNMGSTGAGQRRIEGGEGPTAAGILWVTPIDDDQSLIFYFVYKPAANTGHIVKSPASYKGDGGLAAVEMAPFGEYGREGPVKLGYEFPATVVAQDATMLEHMGPVAGSETLIAGDEGVNRLRRKYLRQIEAVREGKDPIGVFREPTLVEARGVEEIHIEEKREELAPV